MVRPNIEERPFVAGVWGATIALVALAVVRWTDVRLSDGELGPYELFPLLGMAAFTLMWAHYISGIARRHLGVRKAALKLYFDVTAWLVLALILLHPGLFWYTLWVDGLGLPPGSYLSLYPDATTQFALVLGSISLLIFLAFELRRRYKSATWWKYVEYANIAAMFAIFYHALTLGGEVASGWFRIVWFFYGAILALALCYTYYRKKGGFYE